VVFRLTPFAGAVAQEFDASHQDDADEQEGTANAAPEADFV
jgi:hypothetical protein